MRSRDGFLLDPVNFLLSKGWTRIGRLRLQVGVPVSPPPHAVSYHDLPRRSYDRWSNRLTPLDGVQGPRDVPQ
jgi:hypothetical protein